MNKHIDVVALLVIALAILAFSKFPDMRTDPGLRLTQIRYQVR